MAPKEPLKHYELWPPNPVVPRNSLLMPLPPGVALLSPLSR